MLDHPNDPVAARAWSEGLRDRVFPPTDSVEIQTLTDAGAFIGLSEAIICDWWSRYTDHNRHYHLINQNCSTITANALIAGGGTHFASTPMGSGAFWTPSSAFDFAKSIKKVIDKAQAKCTVGHAQLAAIPGIPHGPAAGLVWTKDEWYRESEATVSIFARRYKLLEQIDNLLLFYYQKLVPNTFFTADLKSELIIECLSRIEAKLFQILADRNRSKRKEAIGRLAAQCAQKKLEERQAIEARHAAAAAHRAAAAAAQAAAEQRQRDIAEFRRQADEMQRQMDAMDPERLY